MNVNDPRPNRLDRAVHQITTSLDNGLSGVRNRVGALERTTTKVESTAESVHTLAVEHGKTLGKQMAALSRQEKLLGQIAEQFGEHLAHEKFVREQEEKRSRITDIKAELREGFELHREVRRAAHALVVWLGDARVSSPPTGVRHVPMPDYWLGQACPVLAEWCAGNEPGVEEQLRRVRATNLPAVARFFALINAKVGRAPEAADWLDVYLRSRDEDRVDDELRSVLNGAMLGAFGTVARDRVVSTVQEWSLRTGRPPNQIARYAEAIERRQRGSDELAPLFKGLGGPQHTDRIIDWYRPSTSLPRLHDMLAPLRSGAPAERPAGLVDRMIEKLIDEPAPEEARLQQELADVQQQTGRHGDWSAPPGFRGTIVELFTRITLHPDKYEACLALRRVALSAVAEDLNAAIAKVHQLHTGSEEPGAKPEPSVTIKRDSILSDVEKKLTAAHRRETAAQVDRVNWNLTGLAWIVAGALLVAASAWAFAENPFPVFGVILALAGGGALVWGGMSYRLRGVRQDRLRAAREEKLDDEITDLRRIFTGYQRLCEMREANLAQAQDLHTLIRAASRNHEPGPAETPIPGPYPEWSIRPRESIR